MEKSLGREHVNENWLFYATTDESIEAICKNNFDFRNSARSAGTNFGQG